MGCSIQALWAISEDDPSEYMSKEEREALKFVPSTVRGSITPTAITLSIFHLCTIIRYREEARDMFYHAYNAYMVGNNLQILVFSCIIDIEIITHNNFYDFFQG